MSGPRAVVALSCFYLLVAGAALALWLRLTTGALPAWAGGLCAAPLLICAAWSATARQRKQLAMRSMACVLGFPIALLFWGAPYGQEQAAQARGTEQQASSPTLLNRERLFQGALAKQHVDLQSSALTSIDSALFADGCELRLSRFASASQSAQYLSGLLAMPGARQVAVSGRRGVRVSLAGAAQVQYYEQHGPELLELRAASLEQALARLSSQGVPPPVPAQAPAPAPEPPVVWPFAVTYALLHALAFVAFVGWGGQRLMRVPPEPSAQVASPEQLRARLASLPTLGLPVRVQPGQQPNTLRFELIFPPEVARSHQIWVQIDGARRELRVRELTRIQGERPRDAAEADMRALLERGIDPARPPASKVYGSSVQISVLEPTRLRELPLRLTSSGVELPPEQARNLDGDRFVELLCALATRSGYGWRPVFFGIG